MNPAVESTEVFMVSPEFRLLTGYVFIAIRLFPEQDRYGCFIPELCADPFFVKHSVDKVQDKLALDRRGMGDTGTMQIGMTAD
jgi:hypothetical protein